MRTDSIGLKDWCENIHLQYIQFALEKRKDTSNGLVHTNHIKHISHLPFIWYLVRQFWFYSLRSSYICHHHYIQDRWKEFCLWCSKFGKIKNSATACLSKQNVPVTLDNSKCSQFGQVDILYGAYTFVPKSFKIWSAYNTVYPLKPASQMQK